MEESLSFAPLMLVLLLAFLVPILLSRFKKLPMPIVVGEILAGILVGRSGLGWVKHHDPVLDLLSEFGFVFLMFLSGMEIDFSMLGLNNGNRGQQSVTSADNESRRGVHPVLLGGLLFGGTLLLSGIIGLGLRAYNMVNDPWMMGLILSTTSLGVVVPVLKERHLSRSRYGQTMIISALIADFATMLLITVYVAVYSNGLTLDILLISILFVAFILFYRFGNFFFNHIAIVRHILDELSSATAQIKMRAAFTVMLMFVALSEVLGTEIILGAFLAGAVISLLRRPADTDMVHQLEAIGYGFFIPIFFIMVGVDFNFKALMQSPGGLWLVLILLLAAALVKLVPALLLRLNFSWREAIGAGTLLSARLSLIIAASSIGLRMGVINEAMNTTIILLAVISVTVSPLIFNHIIPAPQGKRRRPIIVIGAGPMGLQIAERMRGYNGDVVLIDMDEQRVANAQERGFAALCAPVDRSDPRAEPYLAEARAVVCAYGDVEANHNNCVHIRKMYGIEHIVTEMIPPEDILLPWELSD